MDKVEKSVRKINGVSLNQFMDERIFDKIYQGDLDILDDIYMAMYTVWEDKAPCEECRCDEPFWIVENENGFECRCAVCGGRIHTATMDEVGMAMLQAKQLDKLRKFKRFIKIKRIRELPLMYQMDVNWLTILFGYEGLGYKFSKYYNGFSEPSRKHSKFLTKVYNSPEYFLGLLKKHYRQIPEDVYRRSYNATKYLIDNSDDKSKKTAYSRGRRPRKK